MKRERRHASHDYGPARGATGPLLRAKTSRGNWTGSAINNPTFDQEWTLGQTGNWALHKLDLDGDLNYNETGELNDSGTFNAVNELRERDIDSSSSTDYTLDYDKPGNLIDDGKDYKYQYDVWGRLRFVRDQSDDLVAEYRYNGLNHRIGWHSDVTDGSDGTLEQRRYYCQNWAGGCGGDPVGGRHPGRAGRV